MGEGVALDLVAQTGGFVMGAATVLTEMELMEEESLKLQATATKAFNAMGAAARNAAHGGGGHGGGLHGLMNELKGSFGRRSTAFHFLHLLEGGGPIIALGLAARMFSHVAEGAEKLAEGVRSGSISMDEMLPKIVEMIPILGDLHKGFLAIWNAADPIGQDLTKQIDEQKTLTKEIHEQVALSTARSEAERKRLELEKRYGEMVEKIRKAEKEAAGEQDQNASAHKIAAQQIAELEKGREADLKKIADEEEKAAAEKEKWKGDAIRRAQEEYQKELYGAEAYELVELAMRGMNDEQLEAIKRWKEGTAALKEQHKALDEAKKKAEEHERAVQSTLQTLHDQVTELLMGKEAFEDFKLAEQGATEAQREQAKASRQYIEMQKIVEENETANEKLAKEAYRLATLRDQLGEETYRRAMDRARKAASDTRSIGGGELVGVDALWSRITASTGSAQVDANAAAANAIIAAAEARAKADMDEQKKHTELLGKIAAKPSGLG